MDYVVCDRGEVCILGAGVAGSVLAYLLSKRGVRIRVYDMWRSYVKPCGEAIPSWLLEVIDKHGLPRPRILNTVKRYVIIGSDGRVVREVEFKDPPWLIIDKSEWINRLRAEVNIIVKPVRSYPRRGIVVDSRGPFSSRGGKIVVWRAYGKVEKLADDEAYIVIDWSRGVGLAWVFPHGDKANFGGGFAGVSEPRRYTVKLLSKAGLINTDKVEGEAYSILTIPPRIDLGSDNVVRVGEAAGLVMSLGGEGIRPAVLSAIALASVVKLEDELVLDVKLYRRLVHGLVREAKLHARILKFASLLGEKAAYRALTMASDSLLKSWFEGKLNSVSSIIFGMLGRKSDGD
ncbi:NAD(P)/FAD-dependent oxidoreductase [Hyperthermus butylicus]|uniref:Conserved crenarchaeal protein n=1 Tax=Hyperthermus butylicus (strain DSM 5456 / JCM 9403 / PLM1-5) TaxID=415426 RepID=A2BM50_HYPBU|nr:NAD(P)-binding protein [Hyperthermus butylicus]ABM81061.1 conserved crenarchaeal protein [Hyperthermus butylicus DSM 5456]